MGTWQLCPKCSEFRVKSDENTRLETELQVTCWYVLYILVGYISFLKQYIQPYSL